MTSWESLKRTLKKLWGTPVVERPGNQRTLDDVVGEYLDDPRNRDIVALADCLQMTIPAIYFALESEEYKANVRAFAPVADRNQIGVLIHQRAFGLHPVWLEIPSKTLKVEHESLRHLVDWVLQSARSPETVITRPARSLESVVTRPHDVAKRQILVRYYDVNDKQVLGIISGLNSVQYKQLLKRFGES